MTSYCLDPNAVSDLMAGEARMVARTSQLRPAVFISVITRGEVLHGIARLPDGKRKANLLEKAARILAALPCEPVAPEMGDAYARIKSDSQSRGLTLSDNDIWIAATATTLRAVLVTRDDAFRRGGWMAVENWSQA